MLRMFIAAGGMLALLALPAAAGKLDNLSSGLSGVPDVPTVENSDAGAAYFASLLPQTSAVMAEKFPSDYSDMVGSLDAAGEYLPNRLESILVESLTEIAIGYELKLLDAPDAENTAIIDGQRDYISAVLDGEGEATCAPVIFSGSSELIDRGLYAKYAPLIDATMAAFFDAVRKALDNPNPVGEMSQEDSIAVIDQMAAQGDKALMDHFGVMEVDSPENCPAVLAIIEAAHVLTGQTGIRIRAAQARGASRL